jgi:hypothetical protein
LTTSAVAGAAGGEHRAKVLQDLVRLIRDGASHDLPVAGFQRNLTGQKEEAARQNALAVRADGASAPVGS